MDLKKFIWSFIILVVLLFFSNATARELVEGFKPRMTYEDPPTVGKQLCRRDDPMCHN